MIMGISLAGANKKLQPFLSNPVGRLWEKV
jgi:hypothetical protein